MILINSSPKDGMRIFQPFLEVSVPLGPGYLMAVAEREGIHIELIDGQIEKDVVGSVAQHVKKMEKPYIFGFSVLTAAFKNSIIISKELRRLYSDSVIIFGGIHPSALAEDILSYGHIDAVVVGEGERVVPELYRHIKGGKDFRHLDNIAYVRDGKVIKNKQAMLIEEFDKIPPLPYHRFDEKKYNLGIVMTSRGCPYQCIFCSNRVVTGKKYRFRPADSIMEDLDIIHNKYKKRNVAFWDDNLLVSKERIYTLLEEMKKKGYDKKMTFSFQARADNVDQKLLMDLSNAGFKSMFFGLETASDRLMKVLKKGETIEECRNAVKMAKSAGLVVSAAFIYGIPGETHEDRMNCIKYTEELGLDMVRYNNATPYPGTELFEIAKREKRLNIQGMYENFNSVAVFIENPFKKIPFSYVPPGSSENDIRMDILISYLHFYFDFKKLKKILTKPDQLGWFNPGDDLVKKIKKMPHVIFLMSMMAIKFAQLFLYVAARKLKNSKSGVRR